MIDEITAFFITVFTITTTLFTIINFNDFFSLYFSHTPRIKIITKIKIIYRIILHETYEIKDLLYNNAFSTSCDEYNGGVIIGGYFAGGHSTTSGLNVYLKNPIQLPPKFEVTCDILKTDTLYPWVLLIIGEDTSNPCRVFNIGKASVSDTVVRVGTDGCSTMNVVSRIIDQMDNNQPYSFKYRYDNGNCKIWINNKENESEYTLLSQEYFFGILFGKNGRIKNLKIREL